MSLKETAKELLTKVPYLGKHYKENLNTHKNSYFPAGHYYSTIISVDEIRNQEAKIWSYEKVDGIPGIDLHTEEQLKLAKEFSEYYKELPFELNKNTKTRYYLENDLYPFTDGIVLYSFIRHFKPKRIIEIGSGFTSSLMLDTNELFFDNSIKLTFIEPYPERLYSLIKESDKKATTIYESNVQNIDLNVFKQLQAGDILFVDSTHVVKTASDVNFILFEVIPLLNPGVYIHFHDVFYPFEYPKRWVFGGRNWNEDYFLRAFLMYNEKFEIKFFSHYLHLHHKEAFAQMPLSYKEFGSNLWLQKK